MEEFDNIAREFNILICRGGILVGFTCILGGIIYMVMAMVKEMM